MVPQSDASSLQHGQRTGAGPVVFRIAAAYGVQGQEISAQLPDCENHEKRGPVIDVRANRKSTSIDLINRVGIVPLLDRSAQKMT
jgi:hypothetical protein